MLTPDQVNAVFKVNLKDQTQSAVIAEAFHDVKGVDEVKDQLEYLDPLFNALTVATYIAVGIAVLMLVAAVLLIGTTIRLSAYARRREIGSCAWSAPRTASSRRRSCSRACSRR